MIRYHTETIGHPWHRLAKPDGCNEDPWMKHMLDHAQEVHEEQARADPAAYRKAYLAGFPGDGEEEGVRCQVSGVGSAAAEPAAEEPNLRELEKLFALPDERQDRSTDQPINRSTDPTEDETCV